MKGVASIANEVQDKCLNCSFTELVLSMVGMELAQSFRRFGSEVTVMDVADRVLLKEEREAADIVYKACLMEGMHFRLPANINEVSRKGESEIQISLDQEGNQVRHILRKPLSCFKDRHCFVQLMDFCCALM